MKTEPGEACYPSKVDLWLRPVAGLILAGPPLFLLAGLWMVLRGGAMGWALVGEGTVLGVIGYLLAWPIRYTLAERELVVRSGVIKTRIAYAEIRSVTPTRNPLSSPAWSLDRLEVAYGKARKVMISPEDKEGFLQDLALRDPGLLLERGGITRRGDLNQ